MTIEQFKTLKFVFAGHASSEKRSVTTYVNYDYGITITNECKKKDWQPYGRGTRLYGYNGKGYSWKKFAEVLKEIEYKG